MTTHGGMTIVDPETHSSYQIVSYDEKDLRQELAAQEVGESVILSIERAGVRANVWRASRSAATATAV